MPDAISETRDGRRERILVVEDDPPVREALVAVLEGAGYRVRGAASSAEGLRSVVEDPCDLVVLDLMLPDRSGLDVLTDLQRVSPSLPVIMLTAYGSIETAVEATRRGAVNFLTKPWNNRQLVLEIQQALERSRLRAENRQLRKRLGLTNPLEGLIGKSTAMLDVFVLIRQVARTASTVLVTGESGTGKELVARAIHKASPRAEGPFVTVNAARIPGQLMDSSLFGHVRGAFSGATRDRKGCFEIANGGTVFLDEVGTLNPETQAKLQRVLQEREFVRVGSNEPVRVDVRIVAASNEDLDEAVREGRFRRDLFYRLNVIEMALPPLRERMEDLPLLVDEFMTQLCRRERHHFLDENRNATLRFSPEAHAILLAHDWPGNVRELRNVVERAVVLAASDEVGPELLPVSLVAKGASGSGGETASVERRSDASLAEMVEDFERRILRDELEEHGYNQTETAKALRVALSTLNQKIQRLGIEIKRRRAR